MENGPRVEVWPFLGDLGLGNHPLHGHPGQRCMDCPVSMQRLNPRAGTELHTPPTQVKLFQDWGWWPRGSGMQQRAAAAAAWGAATKGDQALSRGMDEMRRVEVVPVVWGPGKACT
eukprot:200024-Pelagomonas_calceolata.AAC.1